MVEIVRVQNPRIVLDPTFQEILREATAKSLYSRAPFEEVLAAVAERVILNPRAALHVVLEGGRYMGLSIIFLPTGPLDMVPRVVVFYLRKGRGRGVKGALIQALVDFVTGEGYTIVWAINGSGARDSVWKRTFRAAGTARRVGSVLELDLKKPGAKNGRNLRRHQGEADQRHQAGGPDAGAVPEASEAAR